MVLFRKTVLLSLPLLMLKGAGGLLKAAGGSQTASAIAGSAAATAALPLAALGAVGYLGYKDIQSTAPDYAAARAADQQTRAAADAAGLDPSTFRRQRQLVDGLGAEGSGPPVVVNQDAVVAALNALPAALAAQLRASPLKAVTPIDPNAPRGN